jgi:chemotaxis signal transduction protein
VTVRAVICLHQGERYALPLPLVRRVTEVSAIARVPRVPPVILGVMNQQGRVACVLDLGPLVGLKARPARPEGKVIMLQRAKGDLGLYVSEVFGIETLADETTPLPTPSGAARVSAASPAGPLKVIDADLLSRAIDQILEA